MRALVTAAFSVVFALLVATAGHAVEFDHECSGVTRAINERDDGRAYNAVLRLRCNFSLLELSLTPSRYLIRVERGPLLKGQRDFETITCKRGVARYSLFPPLLGDTTERGVCSAPRGLKANTRIAIRFAVPHGACLRPRLSLEAAAYGGVDGEPGQAVPSIGLFGRDKIRRARGCQRPPLPTPARRGSEARPSAA